MKGQGMACEAYRRLGDVITCAYEHLVNSNLRNAQAGAGAASVLVCAYPHHEISDPVNNW